jgi:hypothetical protein
MTNQNVSDDVVRKIQLLLNLAARTEGNEAEAAAAMAKAQDILAHHNLDLATVQDAVVAGGTNAAPAEARREKSEARRNATYEWTRVLYRAVAEANYCKYWTADVRVDAASGRTRWVKRHKVLGRVENTTVVLMMGDYLYATVMRLLPYDKSSWLSSDALAWCDGCVERLAERIAAKAEDQRAPDYAKQGEAGYSVAMAVRSMAEREAVGNYDAEHGAGAWARKLACDAEWESRLASMRERDAERAAAAEAEHAAKLAAETPAERAKREKSEARDAAKAEERSRKYWEREYARSRNESYRRSSDAFRSGRAVGGSIGIDAQVGAGPAVRGLK